MCKSRLSQAKQQRLIELLISGSTARTAAALVGVHRNTAAFYFHRLRQLISDAVEDETPFFGDESYFGGRCKGKRGRDYESSSCFSQYGTAHHAGHALGAGMRG